MFGGVEGGQARRHESANLLSRASRMQTASARVSRERLARVRMVWTRGMDGVVREAAGGMRLTRWVAGPVVRYAG